MKFEIFIIYYNYPIFPLSILLSFSNNIKIFSDINSSFSLNLPLQLQLHHRNIIFTKMITETLGVNGLPKVILNHGPSIVDVYLFGATVTQYQHNGKDILFTSKESIFDGKKAIRGGIPVVFPQFGQPDKTMPSHGFGRIKTWSLKEKDVTENGTKAVFSLETSEDTLAVWPNEFRLEYTVFLTAVSLSCSLSIFNIDSKPWNFTALLHSYFLLPSIFDLQVIGMNNMNKEGDVNIDFIDKVSDNGNPGPYNEDRKIITIEREVDRIYMVDHEQSGSLPTITLKNKDEGLVNITFRSSKKQENGNTCTPGKTDCVLWNPWRAKSQAMGDFGDEEYINMVCVEPGSVLEPVSINPGENFILETTISPL